ncbi:MAG: hypothetical protein SAqTSA_12160 [Shewanella algae]
MKINYLILTLTFLSPLALSSTLIDITKLAGKEESQVAKIFGKPANCTEIKYGKKCSYTKANLEVVFINKKADWITIEDIDHIPFNKDVLLSIGISPTDPNFSNDFTLRWNSIKGLKEVSVFKGIKNCDYIYIKTKTE